MCRGLQKSLFVTSCLRCHEIGRWRLAGPVCGPSTKAHDGLGVQKRARYVRYRQMASIGTRLRTIHEGSRRFWYIIILGRGARRSVYDKSCRVLYTIVPSGPPLPCGCNLVSLIKGTHQILIEFDGWPSGAPSREL